MAKTFPVKYTHTWNIQIPQILFSYRNFILSSFYTLLITYLWWKVRIFLAGCFVCVFTVSGAQDWNNKGGRRVFSSSICVDFSECKPVYGISTHSYRLLWGYNTSIDKSKRGGKKLNFILRITRSWERNWKNKMLTARYMYGALTKGLVVSE